MRFFSLLAVASLVTAIPTSLVKRDATAVVDAVHTISEQMIALNTTVTAYQGGILGTFTALKIEIESMKLKNALEDAIETTTDSAKFSDAESLAVSSAFIKLQPQIFSTLDNIVSKKPQFDKGLLGVASISFLVKSNLEKQKDLSAELGDAVVEKLAPLYAAIAPRINKAIADAFTKAIAAYS